MTIGELKNIRDSQSAKIVQMTKEERKRFYQENRERLLEKLGKDYFITTHKPNVWKHIANKPANV